MEQQERTKDQKERQKDKKRRGGKETKTVENTKRGRGGAAEGGEGRTSSSSCPCGVTAHTYSWSDFNVNMLECTGILKISLNTRGAWNSRALEQ